MTRGTAYILRTASLDRISSLFRLIHSSFMNSSETPSAYHPVLLGFFTFLLTFFIGVS